MSQRRQGFNTPFADLKRKVKEARGRKEAGKPDLRGKTTDAEKAAEKKGQQTREDIGAATEPNPDAERELLRRWLGDVEPLAREGKGRVIKTRRKEPPPGTASPNEDAEVLATLSDLIAGEGTFDICDSDEYVEGLAPGIDKRLLRRLKRGDFSVQAHLDLHGMVKDEARTAVKEFVRASRLVGRRCVIIVHGRGLRSPGREPVLKNALVKWLSRGNLGKQVLAFASTLPHDGGGGAVYVLLRR